MDKNSLCESLCVLSIYKKEGARAWGWQRSPNKNKKTLLPQACAVTERSEKRINSNATHFSCVVLLPLFRRQGKQLKLVWLRQVF
jgi:hypothetical protein